MDEIQAALELLSKLRWFAEDAPDLAVIATGSLLDFTLAKYQYSMPVGRINYVHLEPLSFEEFLMAYNKKKLVEYINNISFETKIPEAVHLQLIKLFKEYIIVGGLPRAVSSWVSNNSLTELNKIHHDLLSTYKDDFSKYQGRLSIDYLHDTLRAVPSMLGDKFVYKRVNQNAQSAPIRQAINLLNQARICHNVQLTSANGLPLGAGTNKRHFKEIFIDVGLASAQLGLSLHNLSDLKDINFVNKGGLSEQVVGQLLRSNHPHYIEPALYYWSKESASSNAELDYIIQHEAKIIPIEVKSGATGALKSLHVFMDLKKLKVAVRINSNLPCCSQVKSHLHDGRKVSYKLLSIPFYLVGQLDRLLNHEIC